jgi:tetratricopeptide (TPR) repeat protein
LPEERLPMSFHVFLSHSSADKPAVEELARRLAKDGVQAWLDKWNLIPGDPWQPAIEKALAESETCAVFVGPSVFGPWQNEEMRAAIDRRVRESARRFRVIPVLLPGAERAERSSLPTFLAATTWVEFRDSLDDPDAFHRLVCGIRGLEPGPGLGQAIYEGQCPYRGLRVFDVDDAAFFFGREALVEWLLNEARPAAEALPVNRFLAIVGASGSGKSSVARAGLIAAIKHDGIQNSSRWPVAICRPGPDPLESLAVALSKVVDIGQSPSALADLISEFETNEKTLHLIARRALPESAPDMRLVVVVDQFEEVFTLCQSEDLRQALESNLLYAAKVAQGQTLVILTMRADFYGKCAANAELAAAFSDHQELVGPMSEDELRRAIERPMQLVGGELEGGLVDLLLQDVGRQSGALPLLQHTLLELWNKRDDRRLSVRAYRQIGKLEGALQRRADAILQAFSAEERELCRRTFLRLTLPGEGTEDTKRRASLQELLSLSGTSGAEEAIIQRLVKDSLLTTEGDLTGRDAFVEVAHEALIRGWPQLRKWIDADRAGLRTRTRLSEASREWENSGHDGAYLYTGARLAVAAEWSDSHPGELSPTEAEFLRLSLEAQRLREASELEAAQRLARAEAERAAEAERRAQEQKQAALKLRRRAFAAAGAAVAALILAIISVLMWHESDLARVSANDARDQADGLINFMLDDLRNKLLPIGRLSILDAVVQKAKAYLEGLPKELLTTPRLREQGAMLRNLGDTNVQQGRLQEALSVYQHGLAIAKQLVKQDPSSAELKRDLSLSYNKVGSVLEAQGKLQEALDAYGQSLEIRRSLIDREKSNEVWQRDLSVSYERIGDVLLEQGKLPAALEVYQQSLDIRRKLAYQANSDAERQVDLSVSYERVGDVLVAQGKIPEAMEAYQQELAITQRLAEDKSNADWQRNLSVSQEKVGRVLMMQGKIGEALQIYQQSLNIRQTLADQDKSNAVWQRDLFVGYSKFGEVLCAQGKLPEALEVYQQDRAIAERLIERDKSNADWWRNLSVTYEKLGDVLAEQGKLQEALEDYHQELTITKRLADQDKANASCQRDLSACYEKVGDVLGKQGKLPEALEVYRQGLAITTQLAEDDTSNADWQRIRILSFYKVGVCMAEIGGRDNIDQAQSLLRKGLQFAELYSGQDRQERINDFTQALAKLGP